MLRLLLPCAAKHSGRNIFQADNHSDDLIGVVSRFHQLRFLQPIFLVKHIQQTLLRPILQAGSNRPAIGAGRRRLHRRRQHTKEQRKRQNHRKSTV